MPERDAGGRFVKGQSGNRQGRLVKKRELAEGLRKVGQLPYFDENFTNAQAVARMIWIALLDGVISLNGARLTLTTKDWLELVKWLYIYVDGTVHFSAPLWVEEMLEKEEGERAETSTQGEIERVEQEERGIVKQELVTDLTAEEMEAEQNKMVFVRHAAYSEVPVRKTMPLPTREGA